MICSYPTMEQPFTHFCGKLVALQVLNLNPLQGLRFFVLKWNNISQKLGRSFISNLTPQNILQIVIWFHKNLEWTISVTPTLANRWKLKRYKPFTSQNIFARQNGWANPLKRSLWNEQHNNRTYRYTPVTHGEPPSHGTTVCSIIPPT